MTNLPYQLYWMWQTGFIYQSLYLECQGLPLSKDCWHRWLMTRAGDASPNFGIKHLLLGPQYPPDDLLGPKRYVFLALVTWARSLILVLTTSHMWCDKTEGFKMRARVLKNMNTTMNNLEEGQRITAMKWIKLWPVFLLAVRRDSFALLTK